MRRALSSVVSTLLFVIVCACQPAPSFKEPPVGTYSLQTHQVKLGESVTPIQGAVVTLDFFRAAEVRAVLGRLFIDVPTGSANQPVVVLSHDLWVERFASAPEIIGQALEIDGRRTIIVGITQRGFQFPKGARLWTPKDGGAP